MRILFLSRWRPWPPDNGSKLRIYNLLAALARRHDVTLITFREAGEEEDVARELRELCSTVYVIPRKSFDPWSVRSLLGSLHATPRSVLDTRSIAMENQIKEALQARPYGCVIASQVDMAAYADCFAGTPAVFEELELGVYYGRFQNAPTLTSKFRNWLTWSKHKRFVERLLARYQSATVVSPAERELALQLDSGEAGIEVIPNGLDLSHYASSDEPREPETLVFTGPFGYEPNYRGMVWFQEHVYPAIAAKRPNVRVVVTGDHGGRPLPHSGGLTLTGYVDDIRPQLGRSTCAIVPLQEGGGTRLKILEAMAMRTPVISTTKGAEGLDATDGEHLLLADTPSEFAGAVDLLLSSPRLRDALSDKAYRLLTEKYDCRAAAARLLSLVEQIGVRPAVAA